MRMRLRWLVCLPLGGLLCAGPVGRTAPSADPEHYARRGTWHETLRASREALLRRERAEGRRVPLPRFGESDFTILAWIRTPSGGTLLSRSSPDGRWACRGKSFFVRGGRLGYDVGCVGVYAGRSTVADGRWHHAVMTYSDRDAAIEFFVDGRADGGASVKGNPEIPEDIVRLGTAAPGFAEPNAFTGEIDEVRVYSRKLAPEEIRAHFETPEGAPVAGCVGWWRLEGDGQDASGSGNHGRVVDARFVEGKSGRALSFDGKGGAVEVPNGDAGQARDALWRLLERDFPDAGSRREMAWEREDRLWVRDWEPGDFAGWARRYRDACALPALRAEAESLVPGARDAAGLRAVREVYLRGRGASETLSRLRGVNLPALRLAVADLTETFGERYPGGRAFLARLDALEKDLPRILEDAGRGNPDALRRAEGALALQREALLANPLLDFDRLLLVRRDPRQLGLPANWESNSSLPKTGYDNEIAVLSPVRPEGKLSTLFRPEGGRFVGDVDLHWDAGRMLLSMPGDNGRWQVHEVRADGTGLRQLPLVHEPDVDNYDACYLPDGGVLFTSTAPFVGVPCVTGSSHVSNLYRLDTRGGIRRLTFEQDHDWCPTPLNNGRVLYLRWEYSDLPHYVSRILFHMNPDGTEQMEYYGSNSYWPNSLFYARPVPNHPTRFVGIVGGHHDVPRMGELVLFDPAKGRREADGVVQRIPGRGRRVEPVIRDGLVGGSWPKFLHPWPLSDKYFLVAAQPAAGALWGIYLVDVFDNMLLLREEPGQALLEPIPLAPRPKPPVLPDRVAPDRKDAVVSITDIYSGPGLRGVPRGTVKGLRLFTYHFAYHGMGGQVNRVGLDGPWDIKRVLGTVPVEADGSAHFRIPANTPISLQPLDREGKALQLMRSWMVGMPGEHVSCTGCHETQNSSILNRRTLASARRPAEIAPWYGPTRGFSFRREVQPLLDRHCVACHDGRPGAPDLRDLPDVHPRAADAGYNGGTKFPPSYIALRAYVRAPSIESDIHLLEPCEYHADTTRLVRMLRGGHRGVRLDAEAWDRLATWIDLNTPAHGTWHEIVGMGKVAGQRDRRRALLARYAGIDEDPEAIIAPTLWGSPGPRIPPPSRQASREAAGAPGTTGTCCPPGSQEPQPQAEAASASGSRPASLRLLAETQGSAEVLGADVVMDLVRIPAGEFMMGDGADARRVRVERPFRMGRAEVTNAQFARFDPRHDSRLETGDFLQFSVRERGYPVNEPQQPVCRVSWNEAMAFCRWLSRLTGRSFTLPTEEQWEYACRAGTATPLWYGEVETSFAPFANLADASLRRVDTFGWGLPSGAVPPWRPAVESVDDGHRVSAPAGSFRANPWGLHDMHGNVAEWTRTPGDAEERVVRGGSWYDRPKDARSGYRTAYLAWRKVYDVGFRVVCEDPLP